MKFFIILAYNSEILSKFAEAKKSDETYKDCIEMNMPRYRKNASADSAGSIRYPATLSDLALWTSVTLLSEISIREHRRVAFGYSSDL